MPAKPCPICGASAHPVITEIVPKDRNAVAAYGYRLFRKLQRARRNQEWHANSKALEDMFWGGTGYLRIQAPDPLPDPPADLANSPSVTVKTTWVLASRLRSEGLAQELPPCIYCGREAWIAEVVRYDKTVPPTTTNLYCEEHSPVYLVPPNGRYPVKFPWEFPK